MRKLLLALLSCLLIPAGAVAHIHGRGATAAAVTLNYLGVNVWTNATTSGYADQEQPFLDILKGGGSNSAFSPWFTTVGGSLPDTGEEACLDLDTQGWVEKLTEISDPNCTSQSFNSVNYFIFVNIGATSPLPSSIASAYQDATGGNTYTFSLSGTGTVVFAGGVSNVTCATVCTGITVTGGNTVVSTNSFSTSSTLTFNLAATGGVQFAITALPGGPSNYIRMQYMVYTPWLSQYNAGELFTPTWKTLISNVGGSFKRLRFMQALATNFQDVPLTFTSTISNGNNTGATLSNVACYSSLCGVATWPFPSGTYDVVFATGQRIAVTFTYKSSAVTWTTAISNNITTSNPGAMAVAATTTWATRTTLGYVSWGRQAYGVPLEAVIQACNELNTDCWVNIPATPAYADTTYITNLANLLLNGTGGNFTDSNLSVQTGLNASQVAYLEYSNESAGSWNGDYLGSADFLVMMGSLNGYMPFSSTAWGGAEWLGTEFATIADSFASIYGGAFSARVKPAMMGQATSSGFLTTQMNTPDWTTGSIPACTATCTAYSHHIEAWGMAPYNNLYGNMTSTDITYITSNISGQANQVTEIFSLAYTNVGNSTHTYSDLSTSGWAGSTIASITSAINSYSAEAWFSLPIDSYEAGCNCFDSTGGGNATWVADLLVMSRDARASYLYEDPTHQLSSNPGWYQAWKNMGFHGVTKFNLVNAPVGIAGFGAGSAGWGTLELSQQPVTPLSSAPPLYQGAMNYAVQ